jgi:hypothetical protein
MAEEFADLLPKIRQIWPSGAAKLCILDLN